MKITQYEVINRGRLQDLTEAVNELIDNGWQPYGNLVISTHVSGGETSERYVQPMVKYAEK